MYRCPQHPIMLVIVLASSARISAQDTELPPLNSSPPVAINLLQNAGFEGADTAPWLFSDWPPREETGARLIAESIRVTDEQAAEGEGCLAIDLATVGADRTLIAQQKLAVEALAPYDGAMMRMSAKVLLATGAKAQRVQMTLRQWGENGLLDHQRLRLTADVNEWTKRSHEFALRLGKTTRADVNITVGQSPDLTNSPVVYLDDVRLEVLAEPALSVSLPWGATSLAPDDTLPVAVRISEEAWAAGRRVLRWDITDPDGAHSLSHGALEAQSRSPVMSIPVLNVTEGYYAVRLALGSESGQRWREVLVPFTRAEGPLAN